MSSLGKIRRIVVGRALSAKEATTEQITPVEGLSALSLDALTSVAYGPEAILIVLAAAGATALHLILPITIAIVVLLVILVISYRQVIDAYPARRRRLRRVARQLRAPGQQAGRCRR